MFDFGCKGLTMLKNNWSINANFDNNKISNYIVEVKNAKDVDVSCDVWITDPPYADAVHYHELSEFFWHGIRKLLRRRYRIGITIVKEYWQYRGLELDLMKVWLKFIRTYPII